MMNSLVDLQKYKYTLKREKNSTKKIFQSQSTQCIPKSACTLTLEIDFWYTFCESLTNKALDVTTVSFFTS